MQIPSHRRRILDDVLRGTTMGYAKGDGLVSMRGVGHTRVYTND